MFRSCLPAAGDLTRALDSVGAVHGRRVLRIAALVLGAIVVGVATLFKPKVRPEDHWSTTPKVHVVTDAETEAAGGRR